jgi:hypothetical protein
MTEADVKLHEYYRHPHFGVLRIDGHFWEGEKPDRYKVYFARRRHSGTTYNVMASELTGAATEAEWVKG